MANELKISPWKQILLLAVWCLGVLFSLIGVINCFWGNDPFFGIFILGLSFIYYPPVHQFAQRKLRRRIPFVLLVFLALFILWASLGVGELFGKIALMKQSFL